MLSTYDFVDPAGVTLLSLPDPGFGPEDEPPSCNGGEPFLRNKDG